MMYMHEVLRKAVQGKESQDIVIIGKGASIDAVRVDLLKDKIIINANDSESIVPGDIGVFHHGWVLDRFEYAAPRCRLYVTDRQMPSGTEVLPARYAPFEEDSGRFIWRFFDDQQIWLEHAAVISCLRVANELARALNIRKRVFLLGFDFSLEGGFSTHIENGLHGADVAYVDRLVRAQEAYLERLLSERDRLNIDILHVGRKPYSVYTVEAFNALILTQGFGAQVPAPARDAQYSDGVYVVAEITTNHFGDLERLKTMILLAKRAGADFIKLQKRDVDTFYSAEALARPYASPFGKTFRDYRLGLELTRDGFEVVDRFCASIGIGWFASVLDEPSFQFIRQFEPEMIKLPSTISERKAFLESVGKIWDRTLVISTGMTGPEYERFVLESFPKARRIYLLQCTSAYPTPENDAQIGVVRHYRDLAKSDPRIVPGFSSHDVGVLCSQLAVAAGARMIEKHVKLGSVQWAHFDEVALDLAGDEFTNFVSEIRRAERIVGDEVKRIKSCENHKYS